ncbi:restriction endonuclease subunit S [Gordonia sp. ABSL11-1]|uniref:restriction endonuclease subunit S n=1 Tax=Gordonia sp. ABSL11-1 TaxID=3053924 RepID=UPI0025734329|nr:restriction endonuclease subunit S [Gordonia sp. ABSL11-1]MDL9947079.1 restriction endonuclease subunit S [Gordonia sp. ABSL11-1]
MSQWTGRPIKDVCFAVVDCVNKTAPSQAEPTPYKMLRTTNVRGGWVDTTNVKYVDEPTYAKWTRRMVPEPGDIILTREAPFGDVGMLRSNDQVFLGQRLVMYRPDPHECDPDFLMYSMMGPTVQAELKSLGSGSTVEHLRVPDCEKITIPCPSLDDQKRIGSILRSLDELIENNRRRVEVLEEMARAIYREWFVKFRYPGHEDVLLVDSALGPVPNGWDTPRLSNLVSTQYGYTESASSEPIGPRYLRGMDINKKSYIDWSTVPFCHIDPSISPKFRISVGDIFVIRMADPWKIGICEEDIDAVFASYLVRMRPKSGQLIPYYLFFTLSHDAYQDWVTGASTGSTRKSASAKVMTEPRIILPPQGVQVAFNDAVRPLRETMRNLTQNNAKLTALRDLLLPKLVTGQIDVSALDLDALVGDRVA